MLHAKLGEINGKHVIDPKELSAFPRELRRNLNQVILQIADQDERRYVKSMLEPFHPSTKGARVPSKVPRSTMCYESFNASNFTAA